MRRRLRTRCRLALCLVAAAFFNAGAAAQAGKPQVCQTLLSQLATVDGAPASETAFDTLRIAKALETCPAGEAVELSAGMAGEHAFLLGPVLLPPGVTLWLDPGVTIYASLNPADYQQAGSSLRTLFTVPSTGPAASPAALAGFGVVDGRAPRFLLNPDRPAQMTWYDLPLADRPAMIAGNGPLVLSGITLRDAPGTAVTMLDSSLDAEDVKIIGNPAAPGTRAIVFHDENSPHSLQIAGSALVSSVAALELSPSMRPLLTDTRILAGSITGLPLNAPCLAGSGPPATCGAIPFPTLLTELVQTGPAEVAAILTVPDTRLPSPNGSVTLLDGQTPVSSLPITSSALVFDLSSLQPGPHRLHARLEPSGIVFGDLSVNTLHARRADAQPTLSLTSSATTFPYGTPLTLTAALPSATGTVTFLDGATALGQAGFSGGIAVLTLPSLALGPHTVSAAYAGDATNPPQQSPALSLQVNPVTTILNLGALPASVPYGAVLTLGASVLPITAGGNVTFRDAATALGQVRLVNGAATLAVGSLLPGTHIVSAAYSGDAYDLAASSPTAQVSVTELSTITQLAATPSSASFGSPILLSAAVAPADATGTVLVQEGVTLLARLPLTAGSASSSLTTLSPGLHLLTASYPGDNFHTASTSSSVAIRIDRIATSTALSALAPSTPANTPVVLSAAVSPATATGSVAFTDGNSGPLGQTTVSSGTATLTVPSLSSGPHSIVATYSGDTGDAPSSSSAAVTTVPLSTASLALTGLPATVPYSAPATLTVTVTPLTATGSVSVTDSVAGPLGILLLSSGTGSLSLPTLSAGPHTLLAHYSGDTTFTPASTSFTFAVTPDATSTSLTAAQTAVPAGSPVLLNVRVAGPYANSPGGTVTVQIGSSLIPGRLTNTLPGQSFATVQVDSNALGLGNFSATAIYPGDPNDQPSSSPALPFSVTPRPTALMLTLAANPVPAGVSTGLLASVTSSAGGIPTGTIAFFRDGVLMASIPVVNGTASTQVPGLAAGSYAITASYTPSGLFGPAAASAQVLTVTAPVTISLSPATLTLKPGAGSYSTLLITPQSGYTGTYSTGCTSSSPYISCSVDPAHGPGQTSTAVRVQAALSTARAAQAPGAGWLALLAPALLLCRGRRPRKLIFGLFLALCLTAGFGCGQGNFFNLPAGSYPVTVSVTAAGSTVSAPLNVVIAD